MGITGVRNFVSGTEPTGIDKLVDHIDHVVKLVGIEHVGIGSDADLNGYDDIPAEENRKLRAAYKKSYPIPSRLLSCATYLPQYISGGLGLPVFLP